MKIAPLGDRAVMVEFPQQIDPHIHQQVMHLFHYLQQLQLPAVVDLIPAYASLTIVHEPGFSGIEQLIAAAPPVIGQDAATRLLEIPVCYDPSLGPDLAVMAAQKGLHIQELIDLHTQTIYTVYMLGFLPGFPYMGKVHEKLVTPRLKKPRVKVHQGSVGIAGEQTGIYSMASPGGWNIIGQTPVQLFDPLAENPCYCNPGDQVRFVPISTEEYYDTGNTARTA